jgi:hypothetical protein
MWKKLLASSFVCVFVVVLGFAQAGYASDECQCYQGKMYLHGEWANFAEPFDPTYEGLSDRGDCAFVILCEKRIHQLILRGEKSYFAIDYPCEIGSRGKQICSIDEFEFGYDEPFYLVHGGNAVVEKIRKSYKGYKGYKGSKGCNRLTVSGKFIAGPKVGEDPHSGLDETLFYAKAYFTIVAKPTDCPTEGRGCD